MTEGKAPPTGGKGVKGRDTRGDPYAEEIEVGDDLHGNTEVLGLWDTHRMCVFDARIFDTDAVSYDGSHPQKSCLRTSGAKRGKY